MPFEISPGVSFNEVEICPILPLMVYAVNTELWGHNVATQVICAYINEEDAKKHVEILKEKGWHAFYKPIYYNPDPVEFTAKCSTRQEFDKEQKRLLDEMMERERARSK